MGVGSKRLRIVRRAFIGLGLLVAGPVVALELALRVPQVRGFVRDKAAAAAGAVLHARVELDRVERLSWFGARVVGLRVLAVDGRPLASANRVEIAWNLFALVRKRLAVERVRIDHPFVDLGEPGGQGGGFPALLSDRASEAPAGAQASSFRIELGRLDVREGRVDVGALGAQYRVSPIAFECSATFGDSVALRVARLTAEIGRDGRALGTLRGRDVALLDQAGEGWLEFDSGQTKLTLRAQRSGGASPLRGSIELRGLSQDTLEAFGVENPRLLTPVAARVDIEGDSRALQYTAVVRARGGELRMEGRSAAGEYRATLATEDFQPAQVIDTSLAPLSGRVDLRLREDPATREMLLDASLAQARYAGAEVPLVEARARRMSDGAVALESVELRAHGETLLSASARVEPDGSARGQLSSHVTDLGKAGLTPALGVALAGELEGEASFVRAHSGAIQTKGRLSLRHVRVEQVRADRFIAEFVVGGAHVERPELELSVRAEELVLGDATPLRMVTLRASGGPEHYTIAGSVPGRGQLRAELRRTERDALRASGSAQLSLGSVQRPRVLRVQLKTFAYEAGGELAVRGLHLRYGGAFADVEGRLSTRTSGSLRARVSIPSIAALSVGPASLDGTLTLDAEAKGSLLAPDVRADARLRSPALEGLTHVAVDVRVEGSTRARRAALRVAATTDAGRANAELVSQLDAPLLTLQSLLDGRLTGKVRVDHLVLSRLSAWPQGDGVPSRAELSGDLTAAGRLTALTLEANLGSDLEFGAPHERVQLRAHASMERERVALDLEADDEQGALLRGGFETDLQGVRFARGFEDLPTLLKEHAFHAAAKLSERRLDALSMLRAFVLPEVARSVRVRAELDLTRAKNAEPVGQLALHAAYEGQRASTGGAERAMRAARCESNGQSELEADLRLSRGAVRAELRAGVGDKRSLRAHAEARLPMAHGGELSQLRDAPVSVSVEASSLRLREWPFTCELGEGEVSGHAEVTRNAGGELHARAELRAADVRWGAVPPVSGSLLATSDGRALRVTSDLRVANGSGRASLDLPLQQERPLPRIATERPLRGRLQLHSIDARLLLGAVPDVRASAGTVGADVMLEGTLSQPEVAGTIALRGVTLTLPELGQRIEGIGGDLRLDRRTLSIDGLTLHDRDGNARLRGTISLREQFDIQADLSADVHNFPLRRAGAILGRFEGQARLRADVAKERSRFELALRRARLELSDESAAGVQSLHANPDIAFVDAAGRAPKLSEAAESRPLTFVIDASEPFWVRRSDFSVLVSTKMQVDLGSGPPSVVGRLVLNRGVVELVGRSFDIEEGALEFTGGQAVEPTLDLTATRRTRSGVMIRIRASGSLHEPRLEFFVDDRAVTAGDAIAAESASSSGATDATIKQQVSSMASGLAAGVLTLGARREFGELVPVLSIDAGEGGPSVRAGIAAERLIPDFMRHIVVDAYVEGILSTGTSASSSAPASGFAVPAALLELRFPHALVGEAQYGPGERWSLDLGWEPTRP